MAHRRASPPTGDGRPLKTDSPGKPGLGARQSHPPRQDQPVLPAAALDPSQVERFSGLRLALNDAPGSASLRGECRLSRSVTLFGFIKRERHQKEAQRDVVYVTRSSAATSEKTPRPQTRCPGCSAQLRSVCPCDSGRHSEARPRLPPRRHSQQSPAFNTLQRQGREGGTWRGGCLRTEARRGGVQRLLGAG